MPPLAGPRAMLCCTRKPGEHFHLPVVQLHRDRHFHHAPRRAQDLPQARIELQEFRRHIELHLRDAKRIQVFARRHPRNDRLRDSFDDTWPSDASPPDCVYALAARRTRPYIAVAAFGRTEVLDLARLLKRKRNLRGNIGAAAGIAAKQNRRRDLAGGRGSLRMPARRGGQASAAASTVTQPSKIPQSTTRTMRLSDFTCSRDRFPAIRSRPVRLLI